MKQANEQAFTVLRTSTSHHHFNLLVAKLDHELWVELEEDQSTYDQYNKVPGVATAVIVYHGTTPVAIGCYKPYNHNTVEIKRMFVEKDYRGKGLAKRVLAELEQWALENNFSYAILGTSIYFNVAQHMYTQAGYAIIPNYDQYKGLEESICMQKKLA